MDTPSGQDQFSAPNFVANITVFHTSYQVHFVNYEYWTGSLDRFSRHTQICSSCNRAYRATIRLKLTFAAVAIGLAAVAIVADSSLTEIVALSASLSAAAIAAVVGKFQTHFECSYTRH